MGGGEVFGAGMGPRPRIMSVGPTWGGRGVSSAILHVVRFVPFVWVAVIGVNLYAVPMYKQVITDLRNKYPWMNPPEDEMD